MFKKSVLAALIAMSVPAAAIAETKGSVPANRSSKVYAFTVADPETCASPGKPKMSVKKAPEHGTVTFDWGFLPSGKAFQNCANGRMRAMVVIYTPDKGYRGIDNFTVTYALPNMAGYRYNGVRSEKFTLIVK